MQDWKLFLEHGWKTTYEQGGKGTRILKALVGSVFVVALTVGLVGCGEKKEPVAPDKAPAAAPAPAPAPAAPVTK